MAPCIEWLQTFPLTVFNSIQKLSLRALERREALKSETYYWVCGEGEESCQEPRRIPRVLVGSSEFQHKSSLRPRLSK
jgi:hypothetical protein